MIIHTQNEQLAALLSAYSLRMPDDDFAFCMATAKVQQLNRLCAVMTGNKFAGQWSVTFDGKPAPLDYAGLTENLDDDTAKAFMQLPMFIGAESEDLTGWLEDVYRQPVTMDNCERVAQYFRFWYAAYHPDEYVNPPSSPPAKYAELDLRTPPAVRKEAARRTQATRRERLAQAAQRMGLGTIDKLVNAVLALSEDDAAKVAVILRKS
jgi:hypothetical protein